jgi:putative phosphoribosyl transferase
MKSPLLPFANRYVAGIELGAMVTRRGLRPPLTVLGLPRGGVPVAFEVARALRAPLDVLLVRKVGMPWQPELAIGAVATGGVTVRPPPGDAYAARISEGEFANLAARERSELERRERVYRSGRTPLTLDGRSVVLVDDGIATGATMLAALRATWKLRAAAVIVAAPVASREAATLLGCECSELVILWIPPVLRAVGEWYVDFDQGEDGEVIRLLDANAAQLQAYEAQP